jgi:hypothetical protein
LRIGQYLINDACAGDGRKLGGSLRSHNNEIGSLGSALVEEFFRRIADNYSGSHMDSRLQSVWN